MSKLYGKKAKKEDFIKFTQTSSNIQSDYFLTLISNFVFGFFICGMYTIVFTGQNQTSRHYRLDVLSSCSQFCGCCFCLHVYGCGLVTTWWLWLVKLVLIQVQQLRPSVHRTCRTKNLSILNLPKLYNVTKIYRAFRYRDLQANNSTLCTCLFSIFKKIFNYKL